MQIVFTFILVNPTVMPLPFFASQTTVEITDEIVRTKRPVRNVSNTAITFILVGLIIRILHP
jgi:hypothetical protein